MGCYEDHLGEIARAMDGRLTSWRPRGGTLYLSGSGKEMMPGWAGSDNHYPADAAVAMLASKESYDKVRDWLLAVIDWSLDGNFQWRECRSGIYTAMQTQGVAGCGLAARRRGDKQAVDKINRWLEVMFSWAALASLPVPFDHDRVFLRDPFHGLRHPTGFARNKHVMAIGLRGQRSFEWKAGDKLPHWLPGSWEAIAEYVFGFVQEPVPGYKGATYGFPDSDWNTHCLPPMFPEQEIFYRQHIVHGVHFDELVDKIGAATWHDGAHVARFEHAVLCVTGKKINGNTAPMYAQLTLDSGETDFLALDPGNRSDIRAGEATFDGETVKAKRVTGETDSLAVTKYNVGKMLYWVECQGNKLVVHEGGAKPAPAPAPPPDSTLAPKRKRSGPCLVWLLLAIGTLATLGRIAWAMAMGGMR